MIRGLLLQALFLAIPAVPLLWAVLAAIPATRPLAARTLVVTVVPALAAALLLPSGTGIHTAGLLLGTEWRLDGPIRPLLVVTALLWAAAAWHGRGYLGEDAERWRFDGFFALTLAGNLGLLVAMDPVTFYTCFALMSLASYGLVVHTGSDEALHAGRVYIIMAVAGEVALLAGMLGVAGGIAGLWPALWAGLAIKAGVVPLHLWLPLAHPAAPAPASAVLSGAMIKAGLVGWLRFPPPEAMAIEAGTTMVVLGVTGALAAALVGITQRRPKTVLAYSSISQMGVMAAALGLAWRYPPLADPLQVAVIAYAVHHALVKTTLFLAAGWLERSGGWPPRVILAVAALVMAGLPATGGAAAKAVLKDALAQLPTGADWATTLLTASALATALLMGRLLVCARPPGTPRPPSRAMALATGAMLALTLAAPLTWGTLATGTGASVTKGLSGTLWPLLLAAVASAVLARVQGLRPWGPHLPAGDLLALLPVPPRLPWSRPPASRAWQRLLRERRDRIAGRLHRGEDRLGAWTGTGAALLAVLAAVVLTLR
ncbi:complex I subunit 5 family protein [Arhodomonas sp. SL1]|uniref:complex I subunit 5 family protein n=1 Tax=Arhodomonas sp. SL1 TaxID=3425691 RepID=UPI003F885A20